MEENNGYIVYEFDKPNYTFANAPYQIYASTTSAWINDHNSIFGVAYSRYMRSWTDKPDYSPLKGTLKKIKTYDNLSVLIKVEENIFYAPTLAHSVAQRFFFLSLYVVY